MKGWGKEMLCSNFGRKIVPVLWADEYRTVNRKLIISTRCISHWKYHPRGKVQYPYFGGTYCSNFLHNLGLKIKRRHVITSEDEHLKISKINIYHMLVFNPTLTSTTPLFLRTVSYPLSNQLLRITYLYILFVHLGALLCPFITSPTS